MPVCVRERKSSGNFCSVRPVAFVLRIDGGLLGEVLVGVFCDLILAVFLAVKSKKGCRKICKNSDRSFLNFIRKSVNESF